VGKQTKNKIITIFLLLIFLSFPLITPPLASASNSTQWNLSITSLNGTTINLAYDDLLAMPKTIVSADLLCYGNRISIGAWGGVKLSDLLNQTGIDQSVATIDFTAQDGYSVSIPINTAMRSDIIVAYDLDGAQLNELLRLVVPEANGNIWIAMIISINMSISSVDQAQSTTIGQSVINQYQSIFKAPVQTPQQSESIVQTQPILLSNKTIIEPTTTPTNVTMPRSEQKTASQQDVVLSFDFVYWFLLGVGIAAFVAGFVVYAQKKTHLNNIKY
jgi:DMSO/TMAO reductase YedYZ molybdopterin-dependent catalytic subunit